MLSAYFLVYSMHFVASIYDFILSQSFLFYLLRKTYFRGPKCVFPAKLNSQEADDKIEMISLLVYVTDTDFGFTKVNSR